MPLSQFTLRQGSSVELELFPHLQEFGHRKNTTIQLNSFEVAISEYLRIYFITEGKFEWVVNRQPQILYPGDTAIVLPGQEIGGSHGYFGIGTFSWLFLRVRIAPDGRINLDKWSGLSASDCLTIGKILLLNNLPVLKVKEVGGLFHEMQVEIHGQEIGYVTRVNHIIDSLLIIIGRQSTRQAISRRDFPQAFMKLEQSLRKNLAHQWTVEEMSAMVGLGTTAFTEKVKSYTGFSPLHYLINIRVSEAIKLLKRDNGNITDIALGTGFYSSQHFSTTFKKLTGHTPGEFRKRNSSND